MTRTSDVVVAFMVAQGRHVLQAGTPIPYARLRQMYRTDDECRQCARFVRGSAEPVSFEAWVARGGIERLAVIQPARLLATPPLRHGTGEVAREVTGDLNGGSNLVLVVRGRDADDLYLVTQADPPRVSLEDADVIAFVEQDPDSAALKALWLDWNAREKWLSELDWAGFARSARLSLDRRMIDVASRVFARTSVTDETRRAWHGLVRERRPTPTLTYEFRFAATCQPLTLVSERDSAHANLAGALDAAIAYAQRSKLAGWTQTFESARQALEGPPGPSIAWTLFEGALAPAAQRLLDAAWKADVFGGMGSWNDVELPPGQTEIGRALHTALKAAVEAAVNAD